jgi:hypothetical protein
LVIFGVAPAVTFALTSHAAAEKAEEPDEYVVYVDKVNLRAEPSTEAEVITVLRRGDRAEYLRPDVVEKEDYIWRKVRYDGYEGWVADRYVLRSDVYGAFKDADERGKAGDARGMLAAIVEANRTLGIDREYEDYYYSVSPDGEKVIVEVEKGWRDWPEEVLYFANGRGFVDHLTMGAHIPGAWDAGSRYYAYAGIPLDGWWSDTCPGQVALYDAAVNKAEYLGWCLTSGDFELEEWHPNYWPHAYELAGGYLIWFTVDEFEDVPKPYRYFKIPVLYVYDLKTKKVRHVLRGDVTTIEDEPEGGRGWDYYRIQMKPSGSAPPAVKRSGLYEEYDGAWSYAWESHA